MATGVAGELGLALAGRAHHRVFQELDEVGGWINDIYGGKGDASLTSSASPPPARMPGKDRGWAELPESLDCFKHAKGIVKRLQQHSRAEACLAMELVPWALTRTIKPLGMPWANRLQRILGSSLNARSGNGRRIFGDYLL